MANREERESGRETEKAPSGSGLISRVSTAGSPSFEGGLHGCEGSVQIRADALHHRDDRDGDAGGDEAIFDGGGTRIVFQKVREKLGHGGGISSFIHVYLPTLNSCGTD